MFPPVQRGINPTKYQCGLTNAENTVRISKEYSMSASTLQVSAG